MTELAPTLRRAILRVADHLGTVPQTGHQANPDIARAIGEALDNEPLDLAIRTSAAEPGLREIRLCTDLSFASADYGPFLSWWVDEDGALVPEKGLVVAVLNNVIPMDYAFIRFVYSHEGDFIEVR